MRYDNEAHQVQEETSHALLMETHERYGIIRFNRPHERNPLSLSTIEELETSFFKLVARPDISTIIFTGAQDVFASGANIRELQILTPATALEFARRGQNIFQQISDAKQLTIAAINGYCIGGALDLALACKLRVASPDALFAHPGARPGITTGWGGTQRLPRLIGAARAIEMFATARRITASEAYEIGLINFLSDSPLDFAQKLITDDQSFI
jgi:enoyl-CoA hydratase/carnithine racemase